MGRGPNAVISLVYWKARLASMLGSGPESDGAVTAGCACEASAASGCAAAFAVFPLLQALSMSANASTKVVVIPTRHPDESRSGIIVLVCHAVFFAAPDAPGRQSRCSEHKGRPWVRRRGTYLG